MRLEHTICPERARCPTGRRVLAAGTATFPCWRSDLHPQLRLLPRWRRRQAPFPSMHQTRPNGWPKAVDPQATLRGAHSLV